MSSSFSMYGVRRSRPGIRVTLGGAAAASGTLATLLFEVSPHDSVSFATVSAAVVLLALVACWLPTRRAMAVDPTTALRTD